MRLTVTTAKYILVPIIIAIFIVYSGYCLYIHVTQTPGISLQLSSELPPLPYLAFVLPYGPAVATLFNTLPSLPTPTWPFAALDPVRDAQLPPQQLNAFGGHPISDYFTVRNRSFNSRSIQDLVSNVSTVYTMDPRNRKWDPPSLQFTLTLQRSQLFTTDTPPPQFPFVLIGALGSRLTNTQEFGSIQNLDLSTYPEDYNGFTDIRAKSRFSRDINSLIQDGNWGSLSTYTVQAFRYEYLNGTKETFFEMANIGQMDVPPNIGLNAADGMVIYLRLASQWTTVYREYQPIPWAQTISAIATAFQILLLTGLMFLFGQGRFSPYGLLHRILPGADHTTYLPVGSDEMSKFRFFVNEYLDTTPLGIAAVGLGYAPPPRKRPLPVTAVSVLALLFLLASFIMYLLALFGGNGDLFVKNISFLDITKTTQPVETRTTLGLGLWGYCSKSAKAHHCTEATMTELFQSFDFNSTVLGPDAFPSKTNAVDFVLLLGASVFMAIALFSRMISFWLRSLNGTSDVVAPATSSVALLSGFVAFATLIAYYTNIKHNVESWGEGWIGHLGIGVTLVGCAVLLNIISAVLLFWELRIMRQKERDMKEWKRESFARESMSNDASATATQYDVPKNDNPA